MLSLVKRRVIPPRIGNRVAFHSDDCQAKKFNVVCRIIDLSIRSRRHYRHVERISQMTSATPGIG